MSMSTDPNNINRLDGVRNHIWFPKYHMIRITVILAIMAFAINMPEIPTLRNFLAVLGCLVWLYEMTEIGYAYARWNTLTSPQENVNFFDVIKFRLSHFWTVVFHVIRIVAGTILILTGSL